MATGGAELAQQRFMHRRDIETTLWWHPWGRALFFSRSLALTPDGIVHVHVVCNMV